MSKCSCTTREGRHRLFALALLIRDCLLYVAAAELYDVMIEPIADQLILGRVSFKALCTSAMTIYGVAIASDVLMLISSFGCLRVAGLMVMASACVHIFLVLPICSYFLYLALSADPSSNPIYFPWAEVYDDMASISQGPSAATNVSLELALLHQRVAPIEMLLKCCGLNDPSDYHKIYYPNWINTSDSMNTPWWAEVEDQKLPTSCCAIGSSKHVNLSTCSFSGEGDNYWSNVGCLSEGHEFFKRVIMAMLISVEVLALIVQTVFLLFMRKSVKELKKSSPKKGADSLDTTVTASSSSESKSDESSAAPTCSKVTSSAQIGKSSAST